MPHDETPRDDPPAGTLFPTVRVPGGVHALTAGEARRVSAAPGPPDGVAVPGYEILSKLGEGGMGVVYHARDIRDGRPVALKMILGGATTDSREVIRFLAEAEAVAAVRHPHVVAVYEYGEHAGRPYPALEYLPGGNLADRIHGSHRLDPADAAKLIETVARGVHAAHAAGIVHRDIKPRNVLFDAAGGPKVTDFGIAKRAASDLTATSEVMGTPAYMAPEQARGQAKFVGPEADVWALGAVLYECLAGRRAFDGPGINSVLYSVVHDDPPAPRKLNPAVPRDLNAICLKCLEKQPHDRFPTAAALADDLRRFLDGRRVQTRAGGPVDRVVKWARRDPARAIAYGMTAAVIVLIGLATTVGYAYKAAHRDRADADQGKAEALKAKQIADEARRNANESQMKAQVATAEAERQRDAAKKDRDLARLARDEAREAQKQEAQARKEAEVLVARADRLEYARRVELAHREWQAGRADLADGVLAGCRKEFRGWEWDYVHRLCHAERVALVGHGQQLAGVAFSPDGGKVATAGLDGTARLWDARTGAALVTVKLAGVPTAVAFGPDGSRFVTADTQGQATIWDAATGNAVVAVTAHKPWPLIAVAFSPDGSRLATVGWDQTVKVWDAKSGEAVVRIGGGRFGFLAATFGPDAASVLTAGVDGAVRTWDVKTGTEAAPARAYPAPLLSAAFSPDGSRLAAAAGVGGATRVWDVRTGDELAAFRAGSGPVFGMAFSRDGRRLATAGADGVARVWEAAGGRESLAVRVYRGGLRAVAFAPDGSALATAGADGVARLYDATASVEVAVLGPPNRGAADLAVSPNGDRVLGLGARAVVTVWDRSGAELVTLRAAPGTVKFAAFSPDGTRVVTGGPDGVAAVWDARTGAEVPALRVDLQKSLTAVAFNRDGSRVAAGTTHGEVRVWDATTGGPVVAAAPHSTAVRAIAFGRDDKVATAAADGSLEVWDATTGAKLASAREKEGGLLSVAVSPDGNTLLTGSEKGYARVWNAHTGAEVMTVGENRPVGTAVAYSPDGKRLLTGGMNGAAWLWDAATGAEVFAREAAPGPLDYVAFTADGRRVLAGNRAARLVLLDSAVVSQTPVRRPIQP